MGLGCLFGHDFGDPTHEQEHEQRGEEVIVTTRDLKTCRRCGTEEILTERTTVMKQGTVSTVSEADSANGEAAAEPTDTAVAPTTENGESDQPAGNTAARAGTQTADETRAPTPTAQPDGIEAGGTHTETERSDRTEVGVDDGGPEITHDAVILTDETPDERRPMEWPDFRTAETTPEKSPTTTPEGGSMVSAGNGSDAPPQSDNEPARLYCERCPASWEAEASSLLVGDPCPNCRSAYVTDRAE